MVLGILIVTLRLVCGFLADRPGACGYRNHDELNPRGKSMKMESVDKYDRISIFLSVSRSCSICAPSDSLFVAVLPLTVIDGIAQDVEPSARHGDQPGRPHAG